MKAVAERVGQSMFFFAAQGYMEKDRTLFALLSAIEVREFNRLLDGVSRGLLLTSEIVWRKPE